MMRNILNTWVRESNLRLHTPTPQQLFISPQLSFKTGNRQLGFEIFSWLGGTINRVGMVKLRELQYCFVGHIIVLWGDSTSGKVLSRISHQWPEEDESGACCTSFSFAEVLTVSLLSLTASSDTTSPLHPSGSKAVRLLSSPGSEWHCRNSVSSFLVRANLAG